jgi:hypothetical protein
MSQDTKPAPFNMGDHVRYVAAQLRNGWSRAAKGTKWSSSRECRPLSYAVPVRSPMKAQRPPG